MVEINAYKIKKMGLVVCEKSTPLYLLTFVRDRELLAILRYLWKKLHSYKETKLKI